jgi:hypothetical protein
MNKTNDPTDSFHIDILPILCQNGSYSAGAATSIGYRSEEINKGFSVIFMDDNSKYEGHIYVVALHEFFHLLGFIHEFDRWDRDEHLEKNLMFIITVAEKVLLENDPVAQFGFPYDYRSITNYGGLRAKNPTIDDNVTIWAEDLSKIDIKKLNLLYPCQYGIKFGYIAVLTSLILFVIIFSIALVFWYVNHRRTLLLPQKESALSFAHLSEDSTLLETPSTS